MMFNRTAKAVIVLSAASALVIGMAGCGQKVGGDTAAAKTGTTVNYWTSWPADTPQAKIFSAAAAEFTKESGIKVDIRTLGSTAQQDIVNASATGNGPDIFDDAPDHVPAFRKAGLIGNIDDILTAKPFGEDATIKSVYPDSVLRSASDSQGLAFVPHTILAGGVWFDSAKNAQFKDNPPASWDDFRKALATLKSQGKTPIAQEGGNSSYNVLWFYWLMLRSQGAGSVYNLSKDAAAWDAPAVLQAAQQVDKLRTDGYFQDGYEGSRYPNAQNSWAQGNYALDLNGSWLAGEVKSVLPADAKLSTFPFPAVGSDSHGVAELNTLGWSVSAKAPNAAGAKQFIEFLVQKQWMNKIGSDALNIPARADVSAPEDLQAMQKSVLQSKETTGYMDNAAAKSPTWYSDVLLALDDQLIFGKISPAEFVAQGKAKTQTYITSGGN